MSQEGFSIDSSKVDTILNWQSPKNVFEIRSFLGLAGYYRHFVKDFSSIASPLTRLTVRELDLCGVANVYKLFNF